MESRGLRRKPIANVRGGVIVPTSKAAWDSSRAEAALIAGNPMDCLELSKGRKE